MISKKLSFIPVGIEIPDYVSGPSSGSLLKTISNRCRWSLVCTNFSKQHKHRKFCPRRKKVKAECNFLTWETCFLSFTISPWAQWIRGKVLLKVRAEFFEKATNLSFKRDYIISSSSSSSWNSSILFSSFCERFQFTSACLPPSSWQICFSTGLEFHLIEPASY